MRKMKGWKTAFAAGILLVGLVGCPAGILTTWFVNIGGDADEEGYALAQTRDGGFIVAGATEVDAPEDSNALLMKIGPAGRVQWQAEYGDEREDVARAVTATSDGGYLLAGQFGGQFDPTSDAFVIKTGSTGVEQWRKVYDSGGHDEALSAEQTADGGYLIGVQYDVAGEARPAMLKLAPNGDTQWEVGPGTGMHLARAVATADGGAALGWWEIDIDSKRPSREARVNVMKVDASGNELWRNGRRLYDMVELEDIRPTPDGGFILAGEQDMFSDDSTVLLWKLDSTGAIQWQQSFGRGLRDTAHTVRCTADGGYVVLGTFQPSQDRTDIYMAKVNATGNVVWERGFGGDDSDFGYDVIETENGGFAFTGLGESFEAEDAPENREIIVAKLDRFGHCRRGEVVLPEPPEVDPDHYQVLSFRAASHLLVPSPDNPDQFTIRLRDVAAATTAHRVREESEEVVEAQQLWQTIHFPELWDDLGYDTDPPEAGLLMNHSGTAIELVFFRLSNPRYDAAEGDLVFDGTMIPSPTRRELQLVEDGWIDSTTKAGLDTYLFVAEPNQPTNVSDVDFQAEVLDSDIPVVVLFTAVWSGPCRIVTQIVNELAIEDSGVKYVLVDVDQNPNTTMAYGVRTIPTLLYFFNGEVTGRKVGVVPKSALRDWIQNLTPVPAP